MKKQLFIIGIALLTLTCKAQAPVNYALMSGKFLNKNDDKIIVLSFNDRTFKDTISVSSEGTFKDTIKAEKGLYQLIHNKMRTNIYLENGYDLVINADSKALDSTVVINGKGAAENNFLRARTKKANEIEGTENIFILEQDVFKNKMNTSLLSLNKMLDNTKEISESFRLFQQKDIKYTHLNKLSNFESNHARSTKKKDFKVSSDFLNDLSNIDYDNGEDYVNYRTYKSLVDNHYNTIARKMSQSENIDQDIAMLKTFSTIKSQTIKNELLSSTIASITRTEYLEEYYKLFMAASTDEKHRKTVTEYYEILKKVEKGNPSPKFENYVNYAGGTTSLNDLKGKFVYIDVWATWCGPCIGEIPSLKKVEEQYHGKNIEFVSISVDKQNSFEKWKKMVQDKELSGVQLFADKDFESKFIKDFAINGIPKFILLDTEGNILNANAPRPSSPELINLFNELHI